MKKGLKYWFCWIAVLPVALLTALLATFPLHIVLYQSLRNRFDPYPEFPERVLTPFVITTVFIWIGSKVAPEYKIHTAIGLFGLIMILIGGTTFLTLSGTTFMGNHLYFEAGGFATVSTILGAFLGIYLSRKDSAQN